MVEFNQDELFRYTRHFSVEEIGIEGQKKLKCSSVLLIGAGGIGSPAALYLAAMGIGKIGIVDYDKVELSNLQRQVLFTTSDIGRYKAEEAKNKISALNPNVECKVYNQYLSTNDAAIIREYDLIIDGSDNYFTRYLVNDLCCYEKKPLISASLFKFSGQLALFNHKGSSCYRCLYPAPPPEGLIPNCAQAGILGVLPGILGCLAVNEAFKILLNNENAITDQLIVFDALKLEFKKYPLMHSKECLICSKKVLFSELPRYHPQHESFIGDMISCEELNMWVQNSTKFTLIDVREDWEREVCKLPNDKSIRLSEIDSSEIPAGIGDKIVLYCKSGMRSQKAVKALNVRGFYHVYYLSGGIMEWSKQIDTAVKQY
ncbi:MAG: ThiF family adenylyltransferase [Gammaproteobacteria bacterium]|nr:ThiF family adenylyltransferase [Gammaproteobacteria bacterium]